jgi:hypothetical protein
MLTPTHASALYRRPLTTRRKVERPRRMALHQGAAGPRVRAERRLRQRPPGNGLESDRQEIGATMTVQDCHADGFTQRYPAAQPLPGRAGPPRDARALAARRTGLPRTARRRETGEARAGGCALARPARTGSTDAHAHRVSVRTRRARDALRRSAGRGRSASDAAQEGAADAGSADGLGVAELTGDARG